MTQVHLIHGFNVKDGGRETIRKLAPFFGDHDFTVRDFSYGWVGLMGVYFLNPRIVKQLIDRVEPGDVGIAHSNGCVILHMAAVFGAPFSTIVLIQPALYPNVWVPENVRALVLHNDGDHVVKLATMLHLLFPWAPLGDPLWGDMGAKGHGAQNYKPGGLISKFFDIVFRALTTRRPLLLAARIVVAPIAIFYWLVLAPIEVSLTFLRNNCFSKESGGALSLDRDEDLGFVGQGLILPMIVWGAIGLIGLAFKYLI